MRHVRLVAPLAAGVVGACYTYAPFGDTTPKAGVDVRVELSAPVEFTLGQVIYRDVLVVHGRLLHLDADSMVLATARVWTSSGDSYLGQGVGIVIPQRQVTDLRVKRLSGAKTALVLGAGGAAVAAVIAGVGPLSGSGGETKPKPPP